MTTAYKVEKMGTTFERIEYFATNNSGKLCDLANQAWKRLYYKQTLRTNDSLLSEEFSAGSEMYVIGYQLLTLE